MTYEKGDVYSFDGENRRVIGFDGQGNPVTTLAKDCCNSEILENTPEEIHQKIDQQILDQRIAELEASLRVQIRAEILEEMSAKEKLDTELKPSADAETADDAEKFICDVCNKECSTAAGLGAHKRSHN